MLGAVTSSESPKGGRVRIGEGAGAFASNGYGDFSPGGYGMGAALLAEVVLTAVFLVVILGATAKKAAPVMAGLAIGLALTLIHLISIPVTNTSVNPARSTSQAIFAGSDSARSAVAVLGGTDRRRCAWCRTPSLRAR